MVHCNISRRGDGDAPYVKRGDRRDPGNGALRGAGPSVMYAAEALEAVDQIIAKSQKPA
jgi:hypothetical protein